MLESVNLEPFLQNNILYNENCVNYYYNDEEEYNTNKMNFILEDNNISTITESFNNNDFINSFESIKPSSDIKRPLFYFGLKKRQKPGQKIKQKNIGKKPYYHTKNKFDNILIKIQVAYVNFLVNFTNVIIEKYGRIDLKFRLLDSKIKKNNKIEFRKSLKEGTIADILKNKISPKYTTLSQNNNFEVYEELEKNGFRDVLEILNQKFLFFFESIFYKNLRTFNLKDFGLIDLKIELPKKIQLYENLLMKNKRDTNFEKYKNKMEECIKWHFLGGLEADEEKKRYIDVQKMIKYYEKVI